MNEETSRELDRIARVSKEREAAIVARERAAFIRGAMAGQPLVGGWTREDAEKAALRAYPETRDADQ